MFKNFQPVNDFVLVELVAKEEKTKSGLYLQDKSNDKSQLAKFIRSSNNVPIQPGETIYYRKHTGTMLDDTLMVLKEEDILGIVR